MILLGKQTSHFQYKSTQINLFNISLFFKIEKFSSSHINRSKFIYICVV